AGVSVKPMQPMNPKVSALKRCVVGMNFPYSITDDVNAA
ncbi:MAG: hypothetical protein ACI935_000286, partial [Moritella dasanensis]